MGLFSFIKSAGRVLGIGSATAATQDESKPAPPTPTADDIAAEIKNLGLNAEGLTLTVDGDTVHVKGTATDSAMREKIILAAGNIAGVGSVSDDISTTTPAAAEPKFHTVVKGDTLSAIAQKHLGNASKYPVIFEANKPMLSDPNKIYPGQVLRIPG